MLRIARNSAIVLATAIVSIALIFLSIPRGDTGENRFDVILVMGSPSDSNGAITETGRSLVAEGVRQYRNGAAPRLLISGGAAENQFVEAAPMAHFAESLGVPASAIFTETQSRDAIQKAYYSARIMQSRDWESALVVETPSRLRWDSLIFRYYPISWRMQAAPWPDGTPFLTQAGFWSRDAILTCYARVFGFGTSSQYIPRVHFTPPHF